MHHKEELSLRKFLNRFPTEESCEEYLFQQKWPDGLFARSVVAVSFTTSRDVSCISVSTAVTRAPSRQTPSCTEHTSH